MGCRLLSSFVVYPCVSTYLVEVAHFSCFWPSGEVQNSADFDGRLVPCVKKRQFGVQAKVSYFDPTLIYLYYYGGP